MKCQSTLLHMIIIHGVGMNEAELKRIFGSNVKSLRQSKNLSQKEMAARIGVEPSYLSNVEAGRIGFSPEALSKYAAALECEPHEFFLTHEPGLREALQNRLNQAPSFVDAIFLLEAFRIAGPLRRAVALAALTDDSSHLEAFPELVQELATLPKE